MKTCPSCGKTIPIWEKYCTECRGKGKLEPIPTNDNKSESKISWQQWVYGGFENPNL